MSVFHLPYIRLLHLPYSLPSATSRCGWEVGAGPCGKVPPVRAVREMVCMAVSRFLKLPIQIIFAENNFMGRKHLPHRPVCLDVGGYMRGEKKELEVGF